MSAPAMTIARPEHQAAMTLDQAALPVIDLAPLFKDDPEGHRLVAEALVDAGHNSGFFYIKNHDVPAALIERIFEASRQFHEQPRAYKMRYWCGFSSNHRGYVPFEENGDNFPKRINFNEAFDLSFEAPEDHPDHLAKWRMTGPNIWPDLAGWQDAVSTYYNSVFDLGLTLMDALALGLGVDAEDLRQHITCPTSQLRLLRYLPNDMPAEENTVGIEAHSDFECFTILLQGGPGLQVMNAEGHWVDAPPIPGCFVVNVGDIFEAWTGGYLKSTQHRVINSGKERYSFPLFFGLDYHSRVEPLIGFQTPETIEKYPPFKAGEHLMRMTVSAFRYLADARDKGALPLDYDLPEENPFKREAKPLGMA